MRRLGAIALSLGVLFSREKIEKNAAQRLMLEPRQASQAATKK